MRHDDLVDLIVQDPEIIEEDLEIIKTEKKLNYKSTDKDFGKEKIGFIDIFAKDSKGNKVGIEVKPDWIKGTRKQVENYKRSNEFDRMMLVTVNQNIPSRIQVTEGLKVVNLNIKKLEKRFEWECEREYFTEGEILKDGLKFFKHKIPLIEFKDDVETLDTVIGLKDKYKEAKYILADVFFRSAMIDSHTLSSLIKFMKKRESDNERIYLWRYAGLGERGPDSGGKNFFVNYYPIYGEIGKESTQEICECLEDLTSNVMPRFVLPKRIYRKLKKERKLKKTLQSLREAKSETIKHDYEEFDMDSIEKKIEERTKKTLKMIEDLKKEIDRKRIK